MSDRKTRDRRALNCIIDKELFERFEAYCNAVGQSKTTAISRIITKYLNEYEEKGDKA